MLSGTESQVAISAIPGVRFKVIFPQGLGIHSVTAFHLHLVSDSTGDTVHSVARACLVQFEDAEPIEHSWTMVRSEAQVERVITAIAGYGGRGPHRSNI